MQLFIFHLILLIAVVSGAPVKNPEDQTPAKHQDPVVGNDGGEKILSEVTIDTAENGKPKPPHIKKTSSKFHFELKENCKEKDPMEKEDGKLKALTTIMYDCSVEIHIVRGPEVSVVAKGTHKVFMDNNTHSLEDQMEISYREFMNNMSSEETEELKTYFVNFNPAVEGKSVSVDDGKLTVLLKYRPK